MYPLLLKAPIQTYLWGGNRLKKNMVLKAKVIQLLKGGCFRAKMTPAPPFLTVNGEGRVFLMCLPRGGAVRLGKMLGVLMNSHCL